MFKTTQPICTKFSAIVDSNAQLIGIGQSSLSIDIFLCCRSRVASLRTVPVSRTELRKNKFLKIMQYVVMNFYIIKLYVFHFMRITIYLSVYLNAELRLIRIKFLATILTDILENMQSLLLILHN